MNCIKSILLAACATFALAACNTDDLKEDIDNLKDRVESLEAQVSLLNDNMTAIKRLLEGGQTITSVANANGTYTLTLSNGETISLTQGSMGQVAYPEITVNAEGQWVVNGAVLMQNGTPVQAVGLTGQDGVTPKFQLTDEGSFWQVSYDGGVQWANVLDASGNPVSAVGDGSSGGNASADAFFEEVGLDATGDFFVLKLKGQADPISIPVVKELLCEIIEPEEGMKNGYWEIGYGRTVTTTVKVEGDDILVTAPNGWVATLGEADADKVAVLTITAPAMAAQTRATADNSTDVTVQVNKGANWAIDKIQVKAIEVIESYYALYEAGGTITVNSIAINKATFGEATLITAGNTEIKNAGVYFIDPTVEAQYTATGGYAKLIILGNSSTQRSALKVPAQIKLVGGADNTTDAFICWNINFDSSALDNYPLVQNKDGAFGNVVFDNCRIETRAGRPLSYVSSNGRSYANFSLVNSILPIVSTDKNKFILSLAGSTAVHGKVTLKNNIIYCPDKYAEGFKIVNCSPTNASIQEMVLENNTFVNVYTTTTFYVYAASVPTMNVKNNLFYAKETQANNCGVFRLTTPPTAGECTNNICYRASNTLNWQIFFGGMNNGFAGAEEIKMVTSDPFEGGTFDVAGGVFIPNATYATYGASIN